MPITKLTKHNNCECYTKKVIGGPHYAKLMCRTHNVFIQWLSKEEYRKIRIYEIQNQTLKTT